MTDHGVHQVDYGIYHHNAVSPCHHCGAPNNAASETLGRGRPREDDFAICFTCGTESVYTGIGLATRAPTPEESDEFAQQAECVLAQSVIRAEKRKRDI